MAPFKSSKGRSLGKLLGGYKSSDIGKSFGSGGSGGGTFVATGGAEYNSDGKRFHVFNSVPGTPQSFTVVNGAKTAYFILVAGGGSGCGGYGGGGGGGGIAYSESFPLEPGVYTAVIGAGGAQPNASHSTGTVGSDSTFDRSDGITITAKGGGAGGLGNAQGGNGGSGGGGGSNAPVGQSNQSSANPNIPYITDYGNNGGSGGSTSPGWTHGGGGGAGEVGQNAPSNTQSGRGGAGLGPPTWSWLPTTFGHNGYFAGGGGGSGYSSSSSPGAGSPDGTGGAGGSIGGNDGISGLANTGGGGGGAGTPNPGQPYTHRGGAGAGGALIIAYDRDY